MTRPTSSHEQLGWVAAFVVVCLALVTVKIVLTHHSHRAADAVTSEHATSTAQVPTDVPMTDVLHTQPTTRTRFVDRDLVEPAAEVRTALEKAAALASWPEVTNSGYIGGAQDFFNACDDVSNIKPPCVIVPNRTDPKKVAVLLGDSAMQSYWYMMRTALQERGWTIVNFALSGCTGASTTPLRAVASTRSPVSCARHHAAYTALLKKWNPSVVMLSDSETAPVSMTTHDSFTPAQAGRAMARYRHGLGKTLALASSPGRTVLVLSPPPAQRSLGACGAASMTPAQCQQAPYDSWFSLQQAQQATAHQAGARYADLLPFFCYQLTCPAIAVKPAGAIAVRSDQVNLTPQFQQFIGSSFTQYLRDQGIL